MGQKGREAPQPWKLEMSCLRRWWEGGWEAGGTTLLRGQCFLNFTTAVRNSESAEYGQVLKLDLGRVQMKNGTMLKKHGL